MSKPLSPLKTIPEKTPTQLQEFVKRTAAQKSSKRLPKGK